MPYILLNRLGKPNYWLWPVTSSARRPTNLDVVGQEPTMLAVGAGEGSASIFLFPIHIALHYPSV